MNWILAQLQRLQPVAAQRWALTTIIIVDLIGYVAGTAYWYGSVLPLAPEWAWPFIPDCPLFGMLGGLALLTMIARDWSPVARTRTRQILWYITGANLALLAMAYFPIVPEWLVGQRALFALGAIMCGLFAAFWQRPPNWLLTIVAFGQVKYGAWTVFAWMVFWWNTGGMVTIESLVMSGTHLAMIVQGVFLLTYFRPKASGVVIASAWFLLSDYVDYGLGYYPPLPSIIPVELMQWHTILMTFVLSGWLLWMARESTVTQKLHVPATRESMS